MNLLFPPYYFNMYFKKDECEKKLMKLWKTYANHPKMIIQMLYLQCVRQVLTSVFYLFLSLSLSHTHTHTLSLSLSLPLSLPPACSLSHLLLI